MIAAWTENQDKKCTRYYVLNRPGSYFHMGPIFKLCIAIIIILLSIGTKHSRDQNTANLLAVAQ